jgi:tetratricopeptide (TPR) repeat protein
MDTTTSATGLKRCFVVMGYGTKTDYATGRKLDLDKSYRLLIKPVVEKQGLICIRADEISYSGSIDTLMFQLLLEADVVVADLSTANVNAFYELGIRHALKPCSTIIISENKLPYPFDINHVKIQSYTHLGDYIDYEEVLRFQKVLGDVLQSVMTNEQTDSPVYTYLKDLTPPCLQQKLAKNWVSRSQPQMNNKDVSPASPSENPLSQTIAQAEQAMKSKNYLEAANLFKKALEACESSSPSNMSSNNSYLIHRMALATYKSKYPSEVAALRNALKLLSKLNLDHTNDSETVSMAGAIEKKLYEAGQGDGHLSNAMVYFQRGFFLLHSRYNGINLAYLLNCRIGSALDLTKEEQIADAVWARRIRDDVLDICNRDWQEITTSSKQLARREPMEENEDVSKDQQNTINTQKFWILVNKAEAYFGLGQLEAYEKALDQANVVPHEDWMMESFTNQLTKLKKLVGSQQSVIGSTAQSSESGIMQNVK